MSTRFRVWRWCVSKNHYPSIVLYSLVLNALRTLGLAILLLESLNCCISYQLKIASTLSTCRSIYCPHLASIYTSLQTLD